MTAGGDGPPETIEERIARAEHWFETRADVLLADRTIGALLDRLQDALRASRAALTQSGVALECRRCEREEGGSCCGAGLESHYHSRLLLINRLLGAALPHRRHDPAGCFFLGPAGCLLRARHTLCINYLCRKAERRADPGRLRKLRDCEGEEIELLFHLNERVKEAMNRQNSEPQNRRSGALRAQAEGRGMSEITPQLMRTLQAVAEFCDRRKVGDVGPLGFRRSTDLTTLLACLPRLLTAGIIQPGKTRFLDLGCADGRLNLFLGYLVRTSVGVELDEGILAEHAPLKTALLNSLQVNGLPPPPDNVLLFHGDSTNPAVHRRIEREAGIRFNDFDLCYTYLVMHEEFAGLLARQARAGAVYMVYGVGRVLPRYPGLHLIEEISPLKGILALYQKE